MYQTSSQKRSGLSYVILIAATGLNCIHVVWFQLVRFFHAAVAWVTLAELVIHRHTPVIFEYQVQVQDINSCDCSALCVLNSVGHPREGPYLKHEKRNGDREKICINKCTM